MPYGTGKYTYELVEGWGKDIGGSALNDVCGLAVDSEDRLYVFNRSSLPLRVLDHEGKLVTLWGEGLFKRGHEACIGSDGSVYCTDDRDHVVHKFDPEGKLLLTLGNKGQRSDTGYTEKRDYVDVR